jgi:hypothetical protein
MRFAPVPGTHERSQPTTPGKEPELEEIATELERLRLDELPTRDLSAADHVAAAWALDAALCRVEAARAAHEATFRADSVSVSVRRVRWTLYHVVGLFADLEVLEQCRCRVRPVRRAAYRQLGWVSRGMLEWFVRRYATWRAVAEAPDASLREPGSRGQEHLTARLTDLDDALATLEQAVGTVRALDLSVEPEKEGS